MNARMKPLPPDTLHLTADTFTELSRLMLDGYSKSVDVQFETSRKLLNSIQQQTAMMTEAQKQLLQQWSDLQNSLKP